jgi:hypothetical protein
MVEANVAFEVTQCIFNVLTAVAFIVVFGILSGKK